MMHFELVTLTADGQPLDIPDPVAHGNVIRFIADDEVEAADKGVTWLMSLFPATRFPKVKAEIRHAGGIVTEFTVIRKRPYGWWE